MNIPQDKNRTATFASEDPCPKTLTLAADVAGFKRLVFAIQPRIKSKPWAKAHGLKSATDHYDALHEGRMSLGRKWTPRETPDCQNRITLIVAALNVFNEDAAGFLDDAAAEAMSYRHFLYVSQVWDLVRWDAQWSAVTVLDHEGLVRLVDRFYVGVYGPAALVFVRTGFLPL